MKPQALIVEDNKFNIEVLETLLEQEGLESITLENPRELENTVASIPNLRIVFLDLELPNYDGLEIHEEIQHWDELAGIPIVAYTVHTSEIDVVRKSGFHSFLGKPLRPELFSDQLARILDGVHVWE